MKIYVAGKWNDLDTIHEIQSYLKSQGHTITHDWTTNEGNTPVSKMNAEEKTVFRRRCADLDIEGVRNCDILLAVLLDNKYPYRGTFTEIGCALGLQKKVILVCPPDTAQHEFECRTNCFFHHSSIFHVSTLPDAYRLVVEN